MPKLVKPIRRAVAKLGSVAPETAAEPARANKRGELRREALLVAAQEVILEKGYAGASIEDVMSRVGGSKASLYRYFGSKEGLFEGVVMDACAQFLSSVAIPTAVEGSLETTLKSFGLRFFKLYTEPTNVKLIRSLIAEATRFPVLAKLLYDQGPKRVREQLSTFFARCHQQGLMQAPDADFAAVQFITLMKGHCQFRSLFGLSPLALPLSPKAFVEESVQLFLHGVAIPAKPIKKPTTRSRA
jgi:AcrR family transcriptional regulator